METKSRETVRNAVGERPFKLRPNEFIGIEFWSVSRKEVVMDARVLVQKLLGDAGSVRSAPVPQQDNRSSNMAQHVAKERDHLLGTNVLVDVKLHIQSRVLSFRRKADG
jgi:hypothetical protein